MQELILGYPRGFFCPLSILSEYLFLHSRRKFGFNKKTCKKLIVGFVYYKQNSYTTLAERGQEEPFLCQQKKGSSSPRAASVCTKPPPD